MRRLLIALLVGLPFAVSAQINALPAQPHLLVKGHAEGRYIPDRFTVNLLVPVTDKVPDTARSRVEAHMRQIFAALDKNGALAKLTQAGTLQIEPSKEYRDGKQVFLGTEVNRSVSATFDDLPKLKAFLAQLEASEEVQVSSTEASRSDADQIQMALRKRAIANSQEAAKQMASAYGLSLKGVYSVSEVAPDFSYGISPGSWGNAEDSASRGIPPPKVVALSAPPPPPPPPSPELRVGTLQMQQDMYAVYLTGN